MAFVYNPIPDCVLGRYTATESPTLPADYAQAVQILQDEYLSHRVDAIKLRKSGGIEAANMSLAKCDAIMRLATDLMTDRADDHAGSEFAEITCGFDWKARFDAVICADENTVPEKGQHGRFTVTVSDFNYVIVYKPYTFGYWHDHFEFYCYENGKRIPCPLTPSGYRSAFIACNQVDTFSDIEQAAIEYIRANESKQVEQFKQRDLFELL